MRTENTFSSGNHPLKEIFFQPSIGLLSGDWGDDFQIAQGGHLKQSRLGLSKANRFNFREKNSQPSKFKNNEASRLQKYTEI